eukprot:gene333-266_t
MPGFTFFIEELRVFFPYDTVYPEQHAYMTELKKTLDGKGHCVLEMPTGTGKTVALFSLITSYQLLHKEMGKLIFCTRTIPEMNKALEELRTIVNFRDSVLKQEVEQLSAEERAAGKGLLPGKVLGIGLSARRNMCVHAEISRDADRDRVDEKCRKLISGYAGKVHRGHEGLAGAAGLGGAYDAGVGCKCVHYQRFSEVVQKGQKFVEDGIWTIDELTEMGRRDPASVVKGNTSPKPGVADMED